MQVTQKFATLSHDDRHFVCVWNPYAVQKSHSKIHFCEGNHHHHRRGEFYLSNFPLLFPFVHK